jgi:acetyl-CoA acetyltransferase
MSREVSIVGIGMHPWGKWGNSFVEYGLVAARTALEDAGLDWTDVQFVAGGDTIRGGYPGLVAGATFAHALGWTGIEVTSTYGACATGTQALDVARTRIMAGLCEVALVIGAESAPKGFFAPRSDDRTDPDWLRFRLLGATNPIYFGLYARRRMDLHGATETDFALVKVKNSRAGANNEYARYRKESTVEEVLASPMVSDPLRLKQICATSDGAAAIILTSREFAERHGIDGSVRVAAVSATTPEFPSDVIEMPNFATDSAAGVDSPDVPFRDSIAQSAYEAAGVGPEDLDLAEVYDLSTALELDWYENIGLCPPGDAERLLHDGVTALGGATPVNASGGLSSFGEAIPAQALAQVCELTRQIRGQAHGRQVEGAAVGLAVNQGLFGHGSAIIVKR